MRPGEPTLGQQRAGASSFSGCFPKCSSRAARAGSWPAPSCHASPTLHRHRGGRRPPCPTERVRTSCPLPPPLSPLASPSAPSCLLFSLPPPLPLPRSLDTNTGSKEAQQELEARREGPGISSRRQIIDCRVEIPTLGPRSVGVVQRKAGNLLKIPLQSRVSSVLKLPPFTPADFVREPVCSGRGASLSEG